VSTVIKVPFKMLSLKKIKRRDTKSDEAVTEEKFALMTYATVAVGDLTILVHTMSNPVVVIVHGNQFSDAMATAVWDTFFAEPVSRQPLLPPPEARQEDGRTKAVEASANAWSASRPRAASRSWCRMPCRGPRRR